MPTDIKVRLRWLRGMYILTFIHAGGTGLGIILVPGVLRSVFGWPSQDPIVFGICGSIWIAFGLLSILGIRSPVKFSPVLLLQLTYKVIWFIGVIIPALITGKFPTYAVLYVLFFTIYIIGDLISIPFPYVFKQSD